MKKNYFSALAICFSMTLSAQQNIGFENVILSTDSYNNGSNGSGGFYENGVVFTNDYNAVYESFGGFAVSNMRDSLTAGWANQFSAITAKGANNSDNYGIYNPSGRIEFAGQGVVLNSFKITNTTYAALSMRDGDDFAKQFGSSTNAAGNIDGTNGADYFRVWIYAHAEDSSVVDSTVFYLADYRFTDDSQDYIVKTWETVDLSNISETIYALTFKFESSDNGTWGMNTPAYFAIDELSVFKNLGVEETKLSSITVYPNPFQEIINVKGENGIISIIDVTGKEIYSSEYNNFAQISTSLYPSGIYFLEIKNQNGSFSQKIIK